MSVKHVRSAAVLLAMHLFHATASSGATPFAAATPEVNLFWQTLQVVLALGVTLVLLVATVWMFKKILSFKRFPGVSGGAIRVLEIQHIDPKKAVALIRVLDRVLIVGYADSSIITLGELSPEDAARLGEEREPSGTLSFGSLLDRFNRKTASDASADRARR